jgi:hypothetical protein
MQGELELRSLERELTRDSAALIWNVTELAHGFDYSASKSQRFNALTALVGLIGLAVLLVLLYTVSPSL